MTLTPQALALIERLSKAQNMEGMNKYLDPNYNPRKFNNALLGEKFNPEQTYTSIDNYANPMEQARRAQEAKYNQELAQNEKYGKATKGLGIAGDIGKGAVSLGQIFKSMGIKRNLTEPKAPQAPLESHLLNTRIAEALNDAKNPDPRFNTQAQRDTAVNYARDDARARNYSAGNSAIYQALSQLNGIKANDSLRKSSLDRERLKDSKEARADQLVGRKLYEDMAKYDRKRKDFKEIDYQQYLNRMNYGGQLSSQGISNIFALLDSFSPKQETKKTS